MTGTAATPVAEGTRRSEIVADSTDAPLIIELVRELGSTATQEATLDAFDVTLLSVDVLTAPGRPEERQGVEQHLRAQDREASDLEVLMAVVRQRFVQRHDRLPRMGKNRDMQLMEGLPHTGGGEGDPSPTDGVELARRSSVSGEGCRVGVLDTAVFPLDALRGRYLGDDPVDAREPWPVWVGHAAFVVGRILRRAPGAVLDVREVLREDDGTAPAWRVAEMMASFHGSGVAILNMSLGCRTHDDEPPFLMVRAAERLSAEMVVVASAGNHGREVPTPTTGTGPAARSWPAALPDVVAVGAAEVDATADGYVVVPASFTPKGDWIDLLAPGVDVTSTYASGRVDVDGGTHFSGGARWSGTSFAAADVTGELAAMVQADGVSAREALRRIRGRRPGDGAYDVRPAG